MGYLKCFSPHTHTRTHTHAHTHAHTHTHTHAHTHAHTHTHVQVHLFPLSAMFGLCAIFLVTAAACQMKLEKLAKSSPVIKGMPETEPLNS